MDEGKEEPRQGSSQEKMTCVSLKPVKGKWHHELYLDCLPSVPGHCAREEDVDEGEGMGERM